MNIGMCLHPIDPAIRGGDHRVSQTQTEHDISLASASPTHTCKHARTHTHTCPSPQSRMHKKVKRKPGLSCITQIKRYASIIFSVQKTKSYKHMCPHTNTCKQTPHTLFNLAIGWVARPILPPGSPRLSLFVELQRRLRNNLSPTTDSGSDYPGPAP